jgi:predicted transcriptional regulator of viral defense system
LAINYHNFSSTLRPFICFSLHDARKHFPDFDRKRLSQWQAKGYLEKIVREYYLFSGVKKETMLWWLVANKIYEPSYISLQTALAHYGFIPEAVFQITSVTTKKTRRLDSPDVRYIYRNIKSSGYFGYTLVDYRKGHTIRMAEPEKALLDVLYLEYTLIQEVDFESLRLNKTTINETVDLKIMDTYAKAMNNTLFLKRYKNFKNWLHA